jgi:hypothetical protein
MRRAIWKPQRAADGCVSGRANTGRLINGGLWREKAFTQKNLKLLQINVRFHQISVNTDKTERE